MFKKLCILSALLSASSLIAGDEVTNQFQNVLSGHSLVVTNNSVFGTNVAITADAHGVSPKFWVNQPFRPGLNGDTFDHISWTNFTTDPPSISGNAAFSTNITWAHTSTNSFITINSSVVTAGIVVRVGCTNNGTVFLNFLNTASAPIDPPSQTLRMLHVDIP